MRRVEIKMNMGDVLAHENAEGVIYATATQSVIGAGGGDLYRVSKRDSRNSLSLTVYPNLRAEPVVAESAVRSGAVSLRKKRTHSPAQLEVAEQAEFQKAA